MIEHSIRDTAVDVLKLFKHSKIDKKYQVEELEGEMNYLQSLESFFASNFIWLRDQDGRSPEMVENGTQVAVQLHTFQSTLKMVWIGQPISSQHLRHILILGWDGSKEQNAAYHLHQSNGKYLVEDISADFTFGEGTSFLGACFCYFRGLTYVFGGYKHIDQISIVFPGRIIRVGSLQFPLGGGAVCTSDGAIAYLCFPDNQPKTCWMT